MRMRKAAAVTGIVVAIVAVSAAAAVSAGERGEAGSTDYTQGQADAATRAALEATGGGTSNSVERDSEDGATWEVEVTTPEGDTVDVRLDEAYDVVVIEGESHSAGED